MGRVLSKLLGIAVVGVILVIAVGAAQQYSLLPDFSNPVEEKTVDRTGPAVLKALSDLSNYHGATGEFEVVVDLEKDVEYVPTVIAGEKVLYQAFGSVDGVVDLGDLDASAVEISPGRVVTVVVPHAKPSEVSLDLDRSKVLARDRGLLNRLGSAFSDNPTSEKAAQQAGRSKIAAAAAESDLLQRAEKNTRVMLAELLKTAGASDVKVRFEDPDNP